MDAEFRAVIWLGEPGVLNQRCCRFRTAPGVPVSFLLGALEEPLAFFERAKSGTTVSHLNKADIETFRFPDVSADRLGAFGSEFDPILDYRVQLAHETRLLMALRDMLLPELVSGRIEVARHPGGS